METLLDGQATGSGILSAVRRLIQGSRPGDVVVVQYSGHGTQLQGPGGDEEQDEALVPYDHRTNGCIVDDDIGELCNLIPEGVNVTFFMDCCHSGSNTRTLFGGPTNSLESDVKVRFLWPDAEMQRIHQEKRSRARARAPLPYADHREILFSACRSNETAKERSGTATSPVMPSTCWGKPQAG